MRKAYITIGHVVLEVVSLVMVLASLIAFVIWASQVDGQIATHFNSAGEVDGYGSAYSLIILPIIMLSTDILLSALLHFLSPSAWSIPFKVVPERAVLVYRDLTYMIVLMELEMSLFSLAGVILFMADKSSYISVASIVLVAAMFITVPITVAFAKKHNRVE